LPISGPIACAFIDQIAYALKEAMRDCHPALRPFGCCSKIFRKMTASSHRSSF
jgi:hypothetical protein